MECIAIYGRIKERHYDLDKAEKIEKAQMYIDATPGTPSIYRKEALHKAIALGAEDHIMFGSDSHASDFCPEWGGAKRISETDKGIIKNWDIPTK